MTFSKLTSACKQQANSLTGSRRKFGFNVNSRVSMFAMVFALTLLTTQAIQAQTFSVLHYFTGGADGGSPLAGVTVGPGGVLYGTASLGGIYGAGTVFKLNQVNSSWVLSPLYEFTGGSDGLLPVGGVVFGPSGALYGTTEWGGGGCDGPLACGTVFELRPAPTVCRSVPCYWNETVLHAFAGQPADGMNPYSEILAFDHAGNIYGTTIGAGMCDDSGTAFELTPLAGGYTESILHNFGCGYDGIAPWSGVVLDTAGNVYGTTPYGGTVAYGTVYQLVPSNGGWLENVLLNFGGTGGMDASLPIGPLINDASGNLYGITQSDAPYDGFGVVFKLAPSGGGFTYSVLYTFSSTQCFSQGGLAMDTAGNFFGVCYYGGVGAGLIYELTNCSQTCTLIDLHDFIGGDGNEPQGTPALDAHGNLYGTAPYGAMGDCYQGMGCGVVWEIAGVGAPAAGTTGGLANLPH